MQLGSQVYYILGYEAVVVGCVQFSLINIRPSLKGKLIGMEEVM